jgi:hypothetical protein
MPLITGATKIFNVLTFNIRLCVYQITLMTKKLNTNIKLIIACTAVAIVFNPFVQLFFYERSIGLPVNMAVAVLFLLYIIKKYRKIK